MVGDKIKKRRMDLGLTQEELAIKMGYRSKSTINKIELGRNDVSQTKLVKFAEVLDCSPAYFIEDIEHDPNVSDRINEYARLLAELDEKKLENVMEYIDFLNNKKGESL